jgi:hypothetical protein
VEKKLLVFYEVATSNFEVFLRVLRVEFVRGAAVDGEVFLML